MLSAAGSLEGSASARPRPSARDARSYAAADTPRRARAHGFAEPSGGVERLELHQAWAATRTEASRPPWIICWIWTKNSTSRIPPRPRFRSKPGPISALWAKWSRMRAEICLTSSITPKSSERRHTKGWIDPGTVAPKRHRRGGSCTNERSAFPWKSARFVVRNSRIDRQDYRRDLGRWAEPQVNTLDVTVLGPLLQQLDQSPPDAHRRFAGIVTRAARKRPRVEQQQQVHVGGIIELAGCRAFPWQPRRTRQAGASGTRSEIAAETASSIAASAKPDSNRVTSSRGSSPERSPRATARQTIPPLPQAPVDWSIGRCQERGISCSRRTSSRKASPTSLRASNASRRNGECWRARATASSRAARATSAQTRLVTLRIDYEHR